jgi:Ca2+-binding EF-hand superfamily protein
VDSNHDGRVSFREYWDRGQADDDYSWGDRFRRFDRDGNGVVSRQEWQGDVDTFSVLDVSRNGVLEPREINQPSGLPARFRMLDRNRDAWIALSEWRGSRSSFDFFDDDRDGRLSEREYVGAY